MALEWGESIARLDISPKHMAIFASTIIKTNVDAVNDATCTSTKKESITEMVDELNKIQKHQGAHTRSKDIVRPLRRRK